VGSGGGEGRNRRSGGRWEGKGGGGWEEADEGAGERWGGEGRKGS